ncbi:ubiquinol-cytochrome c reductase iron-sulfur subunit [Jatrophihabitans endophyticus]|uniref:cytochrome bc1 complex Rieske iron-sulfur subunit n=1 Tax=Jatrophihabitans endophyticus TaxID=1206085 RepID=UPI0019F03B89|nr:Rieske 2Fe-2S domain-containing protein [Jatrophihabitans endophyticus]MBE7188391.1 Rieske 2Fe-2S domain-containing protein [Jatrophihabitans endophyticus]
MTEIKSGHNAPKPLTADEIREMTPEQATIAAAAADGIHIVHRRNRFPIPGTKAEKRSERAVALTFLISGLAGIGFIVAFVALPWHWHLPGTPQNFKYFTPVLGGLLAVMLIFMGVGMVLWAKWLMPEEEVVQDRHDDPTTEEDVLLTEATLLTGLEDTGLPRRSMLLKSLGLAGGALAAVPLVALVGAMIKKPGDALFHTLFRPDKKMFPQSGGHVPLVTADFQQVGPDTLEPGGLLTVFPGVHKKDSEGYDGVTSASSPTLLIRLLPGQKVHARPGQAHYGWPADSPEYVAFSKICTHAGCPASLYEHQSSKLLCPCHQSQFEVLEDAKPVFGPASRSLPKLPLMVQKGADGLLHFYAAMDYQEPIGPGFWERP